MTYLMDAQNEQAAKAYEDFVNEVNDMYSGGVITYTAARVATEIAQLIRWDEINEDGAPLYLPHHEVTRRAGFSRGTLYAARPELIEVGLIKVVGRTWHAAVGELYV